MWLIKPEGTFGGKDAIVSSLYILGDALQFQGARCGIDPENISHSERKLEREPEAAQYVAGVSSRPGKSTNVLVVPPLWSWDYMRRHAEQASGGPSFSHVRFVQRFVD